MVRPLNRTIVEFTRDAYKRQDWEGLAARLERFEISQIARDPEVALDLAAAYSKLFRHEEALALLEAIKSSVMSGNDLVHVRRWHIQMVHRAITAGKLVDAEHHLAAAVEFAEKTGDQKSVQAAYNEQGIIAGFRGHGDIAVALFTRALASSRAIGDNVGVARAHYNIGLTLRRFGKPNEALPYMMLAQDGWVLYGVEPERILALTERGLLASQLGDPTLGEELARTAINAGNKIASPIVKAVTWRALGVVLADQGLFVEAADAAQRALELVAQSTHALLAAEINEDAAVYAAYVGYTALSEKYAHTAREMYQKMDTQWRAVRLKQRLALAGIEINEYQSD